jgi:chitin synthase
MELLESYDFPDFAKRYRSLQAIDEATAGSVSAFLQEKQNLDRGRDFVVGNANVWLSLTAWMTLEGQLRAKDVASLANKQSGARLTAARDSDRAPSDSFDEHTFPGLHRAQTLDTLTNPFDRDTKGGYDNESSDDLIKNAGAAGGYGGITPVLPYDSTGAAGLGQPNPGFMRQSQMSFGPDLGGMGQGNSSEVWGPDWKGANGEPSSPLPSKEGGLDKEKKGTTVQEVPTSGARRAWLALVWTLTWWIPTFMLTYVGRMKRPDVRIAWREKVALCMLVFLFCGILVRFNSFDGEKLLRPTSSSCS